MCMHSVLSVAAPDEKGGDWKLIFFLLVLNSEIGHSHRTTRCGSKTAKRALHWNLSSWFLMLSCVGVGQGWLQNIFSLCACTNPISRWFFVSLLLIRGGYLHHKRRKTKLVERKRNEFYAEMLFQLLKRQLKKRAECDDKEKNEFSSFLHGKFILAPLVSLVVGEAKKEIQKEMKIFNWLEWSH